MELSIADYQASFYSTYEELKLIEGTFSTK